jgi:hypothetical protein
VLVPAPHPSGDETLGVSEAGHPRQGNLKAPDGKNSERLGEAARQRRPQAEPQPGQPCTLHWVCGHWDQPELRGHEGTFSLCTFW